MRLAVTASTFASSAKGSQTRPPARTTRKKPMFNIGQLVATAGISHETEIDPVFSHNVRNAFSRYMKKDWGDLSDSDKKMNDDAVKSGDDRILASYNIPTSQAETKKIYIITEWDRSVTTILFADEY